MKILNRTLKVPTLTALVLFLSHTSSGLAENRSILDTPNSTDDTTTTVKPFQPHTKLRHFCFDDLDLGLAEHSASLKLCANQIEVSSAYEELVLTLKVPYLKDASKIKFRLASYTSIDTYVCNVLGYKYSIYRISGGNNRPHHPAAHFDKKNEKIYLDKPYNDLVLDRLDCSNNEDYIY